MVAADRLPPDEQELWAQVAARRVAPNDLQRLATTLAKVEEPTRITFFATCAAECKHRALRLAALGDLASRRPDPNTVDRVVRLIEAAPTWIADRAQGARVLLLALAEPRVLRLVVAAAQLDLAARPGRPRRPVPGGDGPDRERP